MLKKKEEKRLPDAVALAFRLSDIVSKYEMTLAQTRVINPLPEPGSRLLKRSVFASGLGLMVLLLIGVGAYFIFRFEKVSIQTEVVEQKKDKAAQALVTITALTSQTGDPAPFPSEIPQTNRKSRT